MAVVIDGTAGITSGPISGTTGSFSGNVLLGSSVLAPAGSAPSYTCRAWVNFNGTGTVAIRASGNVSSITDNGTGDYTVNFTTALPDADYAAVFGGIPGGPAGNQIMYGVRAVGGISTAPDLKTTTQLRISASTTSATLAVVDSTQIYSAIFR